MSKLLGLIVSFFILTALIAGCSGASGNNQPTESDLAPSASSPSPSGSAQTADTSADEESTAAAAAAWPRTITDGAGHDVVLEEQPKRVAVLHPLYLDYFFALDTPPIASGSAASALAEYATLKPYADTAEVIDLGSGRELNLEKIIETNPDVIVTFKGHIDALYDELSKIAPVVQINYADTWEEATMLSAQIVGKEELAEQYIKETKENIEKSRQQLGALKDKTFALLRVGDDGTFHAQGTNNTTYYNETTGFGLLVPKGYPADNDVLSVEALSDMNPDYIIFQHDIAVAKAAVKQNESLAVWQSLEAVKNNHVLYFDNSLNTGSVLAVRLAANHFMELAADQ
ncbi:iron-siderophore ABC transporter substrate-binding protein [Paenibacillus sp. Leaf72]|uniref:iron-siderophore ABC transporter substrate-binding protein n=1 Tax=Paenibacillus sp. Leaf72 TaxID=1736234 RepID=UPI0006FE4DD5|nr:iron-siderophore ABC transporter substrate-binding protein [Paenibacillus sp. Leaf72]KQO10680.1 ferrichrome ABC transporter [Paenibacillus sp. Leaf72]